MTEHTLSLCNVHFKSNVLFIRLPSSLKAKMLKIEREGLNQGGGKSGKFTMEENLRILEAMKSGAQGAQGARDIARMLDRDPEAVRQRMRRLKINSNISLRTRKFTVTEDLAILDQMMPRLRNQRLSSSGFFDEKDFDLLCGELCRDPGSLRNRWEVVKLLFFNAPYLSSMNTVKVTLQPWLLQHFTGTTGFRVELLLANMVAEKYKSMYEVDFF